VRKVLSSDSIFINTGRKHRHETIYRLDPAALSEDQAGRQLQRAGIPTPYYVCGEGEGAAGTGEGFGEVGGEDGEAGEEEVRKRSVEGIEGRREVVLPGAGAHQGYVLEGQEQLFVPGIGTEEVEGSGSGGQAALFADAAADAEEQQWQQVACGAELGEGRVPLGE
jgi:hypothetical protein